MNDQIEKRRQHILTELLAKPHPYGSRTWQRIVAVGGYEGDRTNADWGEAPQR